MTDYWNQHAKAHRDLANLAKFPPVAMSIGQHHQGSRLVDNPTFTYGEMSAIVGPQKVKKTFFKAALVAGYIGGGSTNYFPNMKTHRAEDRVILDFDTEQGEYFADRAFDRVSRMVGHRYPHYHAFSIKHMDEEQRMDFIEATIEEYNKLGVQVGWVVIDGVADLCRNTNDFGASKRVLDRLMSWTDPTRHIVVVIHKTFDKDRATGHLGSMVQKKCETAIMLSRDASAPNVPKHYQPIKVNQTDSRGAPFEAFKFTLDKIKVLPVLEGEDVDGSDDDMPF